MRYGQRAEGCYTKIRVSLADQFNQSMLIGAEVAAGNWKGAKEAGVARPVLQPMAIQAPNIDTLYVIGPTVKG